MVHDQKDTAMTQPNAHRAAEGYPPAEDEPTNDYGRGFVAGYHAGREAGKQAGRASRNIEVRNLWSMIHELEQQVQAVRLDLHRSQNAAVPTVHLPRDLAL